MQINIPTMTEEQANTIIDLLAELRKPVLTITDLSKRYGCSTSYLKNHAWLLPNFGKSDFSRRDKWFVATVVKWEEIPSAEHETEYRQMLLNESRQLLKQRKVV